MSKYLLDCPNGLLLKALAVMAFLSALRIGRSIDGDCITWWLSEAEGRVSLLDER